MRIDYSKTWMLFESGSGVCVDLTLHAAAGDKNRPIDAYVVTEYEGDFTRAARRAAEAVYHAAPLHCRGKASLVVGYDLQGLSVGCPVTGESGGLAFAVALGKRLLKQDPGPVAATGEVRSGHDGGPVGAVLGIAAKLSAAARLLPENSWLVYPRDNEADIPDDLKITLKNSGLKLRPVSSVSEALSLLFDVSDATGSPGSGIFSTQRVAWGVGLCLVILIGAAALFWPNKTTQGGGSPPAALITEPLEKPDVSAPVPLPEMPTKEQVPQPPEKQSDIPATVKITGTRPLEKQLASLVTEKLSNSLATHSNVSGKKKEVAARLVIIGIEESRADASGAVQSKITVTASDLTVKSDGDRRVFPMTRSVVSTKGSVHDLLPLVSEKLVVEIMTLINRGDSGVVALPPRVTPGGSVKADGAGFE